MINYQVFGLCHLLAALAEIETDLRVRSGLSQSPIVTPGIAKGLIVALVVTDNDRERMDGWLKYSKQISDQMSLKTVAHRIERFTIQLRRADLPLSDFYAEVRTLHEAFKHDVNYLYFYLYSPEKAKLALEYTKEWTPTIMAFKSAAAEIDDAIDCYATDHSTAAVFHLMRIAEHGLRALAKERKIKLPKGKPLEWGTWQDIIKEMKTAAETIGKTKRAGPGKDGALSFYNGAIGHFEAFKDSYRNLVMHVRKRYEPWEAMIALNHVRDFMNGLSLKINEDTKGPIKWKF